MDEITPPPDNDTPKISDNSPLENSQVDDAIAELWESSDSEDTEGEERGR
ncbi:MAG: hypothetical protein P5693_20945 [Limnospira sp. PMC 1290.21]|nr:MULTISPECIES: hypothetical protein [unclassified Limnospira]MDT9292417.1 hypothetical protein [Limnospira sp. PMC 1295.21]MDT9323094.1 hypothetical protein [Limnospira sp. PMC 1290.21]